jgi:hypothetical protein
MRGLARRDFDSNTRSTRLVDVEQEGEAAPVAREEPKAALQATQGLRLPDLELIVHRRSHRDAALALLEQVGEAEGLPAATQPRSEEADIAGALERALQPVLHVRAHPLRKARTQDLQLIEPEALEVLGKEFLYQSPLSHRFAGHLLPLAVGYRTMAEG